MSLNEQTEMDISIDQTQKQVQIQEQIQRQELEQELEQELKLELELKQQKQEQLKENIILDGNRIINLPLAGMWLHSYTICKECKVGSLQPIKEQVFGFASTITWQCNNCNITSILKTSPKQNKQHEINVRMITALKTSNCGSSYKVCETLAGHLDTPGLSRKGFFKTSKEIGEVIQIEAKKSTKEALKGNNMKYFLNKLRRNRIISKNREKTK